MAETDHVFDQKVGHDQFRFYGINSPLERG